MPRRNRRRTEPRRPLPQRFEVGPMTTSPGVNVATHEPVATPVRSIEGSERAIPSRYDLPAPSAAACLSSGMRTGQAAATIHPTETRSTTHA